MQIITANLKNTIVARIVPALGLALSLSIILHGAANAHPALFSDLSLSEAKEQAKKQGKLLLVDFTASWCPPCGEMDKTTWEDPNVVKWIHDNAIAIQIDVDKEQTIAKDLKIYAMPSLVVFKDKPEEIDRTLGYQDGNDLLGWLKAVNNGVTSLDKIQQELDLAKGKGGAKELEARSELSRAQLQAGRYAESEENFVWLWQNMAKVSPQLAGARVTFLASEISDLLAKYPAGRARFAKLRDEAEMTNLEDWITLNDVLGDNKWSFDWFDKVKSDPAQSAKLKDVAFKMEPLLIKADRWSDAAVFIKDPIAILKRKFEFARELSKNTEDPDPFPQDVGRIYACLLAAGRNEEAQEVVAQSLKLENTPEVKEALVFTAADAGQLRPSLKILLDDVSAITTDAAGYYKRGVVYQRLKAYDKALANFGKAIELSSTNPTYYDARESVYCELKQFDKALADADHLMHIYPNSGRAWISRGFIYMKQKLDADALANFEEAIKLNPRDPLAYINQSAVYARMGKYQLAYEAADKAIKLDGTNAGGYCNRGEALLNLHKYNDAIADLTKSIEIGKALCGGENFYYRAKAYDAVDKKDLAALDRQSAQSLGFVPTAD